MVKEWEKLVKISAWQLPKVRNKKEVIDETRNKGRKVHFASLMNLCVILKIRSWNLDIKNTKVESYSEVTLKKKNLVRARYSLKKVRQRTK